MVKLDDLGQVTRLDHRAKADLAGVRIFLFQQDLQEGGLAGAVVTQDGNALSA